MEWNYVDVRLSSVEIAKLVNDYRKILVGAYVANVYQLGNTFYLKLRGISDRRFLVLHPEYRFNLSDKVFEWSNTPTVRILRKYLRNRRIASLEQHYFDRIISIRFDDGLELICEIIPRGALVVVKDGVILAASRYQKMKDREIKVGVKYEYPPNPPRDPLKLSDDEFEEMLRKARSLYHGLMRLGLGPKYSLEICKRENLPCEQSEVDTDLAIRIRKAVRKLISEIFDSKMGVVYLRENKPILFSPIPLSLASNCDKLEFNSFDEAIDFYFSHSIMKSIEEQMIGPIDSKRKELLKIIERQKASISDLEAKIEKLKKVVELIYDNYLQIDSALRAIRKAKDVDGLDWDEIREKIELAKGRGIKEALIIKSVQDDGTISFQIDKVSFSANYRENVNEIANRIYERIKKLEEKLSGAKQALEESLRELEKIDRILEEEEAKPKYIIVEPRYEWYYGFRWFRTSKNNLLVVAGKDAQTNDTLLRKYLEDSDLVLHAEIPGGAVVIVKHGKKIAEKEDLEEAAMYAASYSKAWREGITAVDVFYTDKKNISFSPPSGTYLKKGAFIVYKKELLKNIGLKLAIGMKITINNNFVSSQIVAAPPSAIDTLADYYCILHPGKMDKSQIAKMIRLYFINKLICKLPGCDKHLAAKLVRIEKIAELIPGPSEIECVE